MLCTGQQLCDDLRGQVALLRSRPKQRSSKTLVADSRSEKALLPYWNAYAGESCELWLPTKTVLDGSFELIDWLAKQNGGEVVVLDESSCSPEQELTEDILSILAFLLSAVRTPRIVTKSRKIRLTSEQKALVKVWLAGSRWWYNEAVSLYRAGFALSEYDMRRVVRAVSPGFAACSEQDIVRCDSRCSQSESGRLA